MASSASTWAFAASLAMPRPLIVHCAQRPITFHRFLPSHRLRLLRHALLLISPVTFFRSFCKSGGRLFQFRPFPSSIACGDHVV